MKIALTIQVILVVIMTVLLIVIGINLFGVETRASDGELKTPLEWAKEEIASDERYEGQHVMWSVIPVEDSTLGEREALYFIIAITEESDLVMDWYGVHLEWEEYEHTVNDNVMFMLNGKVTERFSRDQVYIDADLAKTEVIEG